MHTVFTDTHTLCVMGQGAQKTVLKRYCVWTQYSENIRYLGSVEEGLVTQKKIKSDNLSIGTNMYVYNNAGKHGTCDIGTEVLPVPHNISHMCINAFPYSSVWKSGCTHHCQTRCAHRWEGLGCDVQGNTFVDHSLTNTRQRNHKPSYLTKAEACASLR